MRFKRLSDLYAINGVDHRPIPLRAPSYIYVTCTCGWEPEDVVEGQTLANAMDAFQCHIKMLISRNCCKAITVPSLALNTEQKPKTPHSAKLYFYDP